MSEVEYEAISRSAKKLGEEAASLLRKFSEICADPATGKGYEETVELIAGYLKGVGVDVKYVSVPKEFLEKDWGNDLSRSKEYISVKKFSPRNIVTGRLEGERAEVGVHLTHNYDLWKGVREERAGTVAQLVALKALAVSGVKTRLSLFFSATPDAHLGSETGAGYLVAEGLGRSGIVVTGNPGGADTLTLGYKGKLWGTVTVSGKGAHSARPDEGVNAIDEMMIVQQKMIELDTSYKQRHSSLPVVPESAKRPTLTVCRIESNIESVLLPEVCEIYIDRRVNPDESMKEAEAEVRSALMAASAELTFEPQLTWLREVEPAATDPKGRVACTFGANIHKLVGSAPTHAIWPNYGGFRLFTSEWGAETIGYNPGRPVGGKDSVSDEELTLGVEILALSLYDLLR